LTGSAATTITIGVVSVAFFAAVTAFTLAVTMRSSPPLEREWLAESGRE
jgi:hypothetical protein